MNSKKHITNDDLGPHSRLVREKPILTIYACENATKKASKPLLRLKKEDSGKVKMFLDKKFFITTAQVNRRNSRHLMNLPLSDVDKTLGQSILKGAGKDSGSLSHGERWKKMSDEKNGSRSPTSK
jgi:hypothetical protein